MRSIRTKIELCVAAAVCLGCSGKVAPPIGLDRDGPPQRGGTLRTAFFLDIRSLDAAVAFDSGSSAIESLIYDRLVTYDHQGKIVPQLAESIDVSDEGKRYVFSLRRGVLFHDGTELTAADVKRSMERSLAPKTPCPVPSYYERISGYEAYHSGKAPELSGVRVEGSYVLSVQLRERDATFLHVMALPIMSPLCKSAGKTWDRHFSGHACGTGPFKLDRFENGQMIRLSRHDGYWQKGKPYLDAIEWYLAMQPFTQRFKFEQGDIDYMREFSEADSQLYRSSPAWRGRGEWGPGMNSNGAFMNTRMPPFDNRHFRRAVAFAINRKQIAAIRPGHVQAHGKVVPDALIPMSPGYPHEEYDYQRALEEMKLAGYPYDPKTGEGGYPHEIPFLAIIDSYASQAGEVYKQQLARIGIDIRIQVVGWPTFLARAGRKQTVPFGWVGWQADYPDASSFFEPILTTQAIQEEESQNYAFFSNADLDRTIARARRSTDQDERLRLYRHAERIVADEAPWATVYSNRFFELWQPYVHGYHPHPVLSQNVRDMWFDLDQQKSARASAPCWGGLPGLERRCGERSARTTLALALGRLP